MRRFVPHLLLILLGLVWLGVAGFRQLNFDEGLALRAGFLLWAAEGGRPTFLMPWTAALGLFAHRVERASLLVPAARWLVALAVAVCWWRLLQAVGLKRWGQVGVSFLLATNGVFVSHGFELRYDAVLLLGSLLATELLLVQRLGSAFGAVVGLLALHHLKGLGLSVGFVALAWLGSRAWGLPSPNWKRFGTGLGSVLFGWILVLSVSGLLGRWADTVRENLTQWSRARRVPVHEALGPVLLQDAAWWLLVVWGLLVGFRAVFRVRPEAEDGEGPLPLPAVFNILTTVSLLTIGFWLLHPHPWAYLAALPAPFLSLAAGYGLRQMSPFYRWGTAGLALAFLGLQAAQGSLPAAAWLRALQHPLQPQLLLVDELRKALNPGERVLDPTGLVYFAPSCSQEWYVDTLFAPRVSQGTWMQELSDGVPESCVVALVSYRLGWLPPAAQQTLRQEFVFLPCGLAWRKGRPIPQTIASLPGAGKVENFW